MVSRVFSFLVLAAATLPASAVQAQDYIGKWDRTQRLCGTVESDSHLRFTQRSFVGHEHACTMKTLRRDTDGRWQSENRCKGEGEVWTNTVSFTVTGDRMRLSLDGGQATTLVRCSRKTAEPSASSKSDERRWFYNSRNNTVLLGLPESSAIDVIMACGKAGKVNVNLWYASDEVSGLAPKREVFVSLATPGGSVPLRGHLEESGPSWHLRAALTSDHALFAALKHDEGNVTVSSLPENRRYTVPARGASGAIKRLLDQCSWRAVRS